MKQHIFQRAIPFLLQVLRVTARRRWFADRGEASRFAAQSAAYRLQGRYPFG